MHVSKTSLPTHYRWLIVSDGGEEKYAPLIKSCDGNASAFLPRRLSRKRTEKSFKYESTILHAQTK